jgi:hypothetical protein
MEPWSGELVSDENVFAARAQFACASTTAVLCLVVDAVCIFPVNEHRSAAGGGLPRVRAAAGQANPEIVCAQSRPEVNQNIR